MPDVQGNEHEITLSKQAVTLLPLGARGILMSNVRPYQGAVCSVPRSPQGPGASGGAVPAPSQPHRWRPCTAPPPQGCVPSPEGVHLTQRCQGWCQHRIHEGILVLIKTLFLCRHISSPTLRGWPSTQHELLQREATDQSLRRRGAQLEGWKPYPAGFCRPCTDKLPERSGTKPSWPQMKCVFMEGRVMPKYSQQPTFHAMSGKKIIQDMRKIMASSDQKDIIHVFSATVYIFLLAKFTVAIAKFLAQKNVMAYIKIIIYFLIHFSGQITHIRKNINIFFSKKPQFFLTQSQPFLLPFPYPHNKKKSRK